MICKNLLLVYKIVLRIVVKVLVQIYILCPLVLRVLYERRYYFALMYRESNCCKSHFQTEHIYCKKLEIDLFGV